MQILLGSQETIIKINSKSMSIDYIQDFISTHFLKRRIYKNTITIPASTQDVYHRKFLLKWLYTLYAKKTQNYLPALKERLVYRHAKAIKIMLPQQIIHKLIYTLQDAKTIKIEIKPNNHKIAYLIKRELNIKMTLLAYTIELNLEDESQKNSLKAFMYSTDTIDIPHQHIFSTKVFKAFFSPSRKSKSAEYNPYIVLGISQDDSMRTIKKRYKYLAKCHHPDMALVKDERTLSEHTKVFQSIRHAYEIVLNKSKMAS
ncbi:MAG: DnaJ domain-containing protein [Sulfurimonas sp.]|nr:DnaJ domain-containing protein [Sulfurimonas sp.]MDQ7061657.1 DnaJ domain-containing protein [Sulfurimonas sp.]